jgi:HlyD family secretion protein
VVTYLAEISVNNDELLLRPGMTATATITVQSVPHALLVSNHALRFLPSNSDTTSNSISLLPAPQNSNQNANVESSAALNNPRVWVEKDGKPSPISVTTGSTDGKVTEIRSGQVSPGMPLIVEVLKEGK